MLDVVVQSCYAALVGNHTLYKQTFTHTRGPPKTCTADLVINYTSNMVLQGYYDKKKKSSGCDKNNIHKDIKIHINYQLFFWYCQ
jgi:hypothetical protein